MMVSFGRRKSSVFSKIARPKSRNFYEKANTPSTLGFSSPTTRTRHTEEKVIRGELRRTRKAFSNSVVWIAGIGCKLSFIKRFLP